MESEDASQGDARRTSDLHVVVFHDGDPVEGLLPQYVLPEEFASQTELLLSPEAASQLYTPDRIRLTIEGVRSPIHSSASVGSVDSAFSPWQSKMFSPREIIPSSLEILQKHDGFLMASLYDAIQQCNDAAFYFLKELEISPFDETAERISPYENAWQVNNLRFIQEVVKRGADDIVLEALFLEMRSGNIERMKQLINWVDPELAEQVPFLEVPTSYESLYEYAWDLPENVLETLLRKCRVDLEALREHESRLGHLDRIQRLTDILHV